MTDNPTVTCHVCRRDNVEVRNGKLAHHLIPGTEGKEDGLSCRGGGEEPQDSYPMTVHLGVLTATRPIGARIEFFHGAKIEGTLIDLTPSEFSKVHYQVHLRTDDGKSITRLPLSHPVTMLTGREGRPEDGHTFRITIDSRMASGIQGPDDPAPHSYTDSDDFWGPTLHTEVRAWDLPTALKRASELQLMDWRLPNGVALANARKEDLDQ